MFCIPAWYLKTRSPEEIEIALEYRLDHNEVAEILHVSPQQVTVWASHVQRRQLPLRSCQYAGKPARAYRLHDVREFAKQRNLVFDVRGVPLALRIEWKIDIPNELA